MSINISLLSCFIFMNCKIRGGSLTKINFFIIICNNIIFFIWFVTFIGEILFVVFFRAKIVELTPEIVGASFTEITFAAKEPELLILSPVHLGTPLVGEGWSR